MNFRYLIKTVVAVILVVAGAFTLSYAVAFPPAPPPKGTTLGFIKLNPYGHAPLTALIDLGGEEIYDVRVLVHGKKGGGIPIKYTVGKKYLLTNDGIPIFGLYANYKNKVTVTFKNKKDKKTYTHTYDMLTAALENKYIDNSNLTALPVIKVIKVDKRYRDKLFLTNTGDRIAYGTTLLWAGKSDLQEMSFSAAPITAGSLAFNTAPMTFISDTKGEIRWWLNQDTFYDANALDVYKMGYLMGLHETKNGTFTFVFGQTYGEFNMLGKVLYQHKLPRGYIDASHEIIETPRGTLLIRAAKANYKRPDGKVVHTVRDHILEVDKTGMLLDVWDMNIILDPNRDVLLKGLDIGAVCLNVDLDNVGKTMLIEPDADFGDIAGVGAGRNWAHINSISYDPKDDSIILSFRHQGVAKITRDKKVKWILAPRAGWNTELSKKLLTPVNAQGKKIECNENGECKDPKFEFVYTQHTAWLSPKGTLTIYDNADGRYNTQPALPTDKYSRFVEYIIDEKNMTVEQVWEYGRERGYEWYAPITSNVELIIGDGNTDYMYGFSGSTALFERGKPTIGRHNIIDYKTKKVLLEIDILSAKANAPHYRGLLINPSTLFVK